MTQSDKQERRMADDPEPTNWGQQDDNVAGNLFRMEGADLEKVAIIDPRWDEAGGFLGEQRWTFGELRRLACQCVCLLWREGIRPGDRVLLLVSPGMDLILLVFSLIRMGAVPVVIDPGMGLGKFRKAVAHSRPNCLVAVGRGILVSRLFPFSFRTLRVRVRVDADFLEKVSGMSLDGKTGVCLPMTRDDDLAAILFTSGSTGAPKGVCYQHRMLLAQIRMLKARFGIASGEIDLPMLPVFALFNPSLGMTTVIPDINPSRPATVNPAKIVAAINRYGVTNAFGSPVLWQKIGDYCLLHGRRLDSMRRVLVAGAAAPVELYRVYRELLSSGQMFSPYGATECLPVSVISDREVMEQTAALSESGKGICVGSPVNEVQVRIIPVIRGSFSSSLWESVPSLPMGEVGEIMVSGPSVTLEYDHLPEANSLSKVREGGVLWHRMGDLGYLDAKGRLWFCGRVVEAVMVEGNPLYTECVEGLFAGVPGLRRSALISWRGHAALALEPLPKRWPSGVKARREFVREVVACAQLRSRGKSIPVSRYFFVKNMPVDVRHNAKIHRLSLAKRFACSRPVVWECVMEDRSAVV